MGQLVERKIVQAREWINDNLTPIPPYDYNYTYPISVYEAIRRSMDEDSTNLLDEIDSIYELINQKQPIVEPGTPGQVMTWSGARGIIGATEIVKSINPSPALRSHKKLVSERAIGDALDLKVPYDVFTSHIDNSSIHITDVERNRWNSMAPMSTVQSHIGNMEVHITNAERERWNKNANQEDVDAHIYNTNNPHNTTAHQVGTYTRREIDDMFAGLQDSFFNYLNIHWDERSNHAELVEYHPINWNPNYVLAFGDELPVIDSADEGTYFAIKPATDYTTNETQDVIIYIKRPDMVWSEVGFQTLKLGDMVIRFPDTAMFVWIQGRFVGLFSGSDEETGPDVSTLMWRPSVAEDGTLTWTRSEEMNPPDPVVIKGQDGYTPIKGIDYFDGKDGQGVPIGGKTGEVLIKMTDANYETTWRSIMDVLGDIIISGGSLPEGIIKWEMINGRPEWYDELGDNSDGFITQRAASEQFDIIANKINELLEIINGPSGLDTIRNDLNDHLNDFSNPHRVTPGQIGAVSISTFTEHVQNYNNPHNVTAEQVGLGNVNNTSDMDKPISNATQEALDELKDMINAITGDVTGINYINNVTWSDETCTLTFVFKDGSDIDVKLPITDIFNNIYFDKSEGELVIVLPDGTENRIDISSMIKVYTGGSSKHITVVIDEMNNITASIIPDSITGEEIESSVALRGSPTTTTQPITDKSTRIATTEFVRKQVIDNLISYEVDRPLSANMGRILNQRKVDIDDLLEIINDLESIEVIDNLESTNPMAALSANMGRMLDLIKAPRVHTSPTGSTYGRATISLFGHARASDVDPLMDGTVFRGTDDGYYARGDHRHPTDSSRAPVHFPDEVNNITILTGEPRAVTPPDDSNDTRIATTEWIRRNAVGVQIGECTTPSTEAIKVVTLRSDFMDDPVFMRQSGSTIVATFSENDLATEQVMLDVHKSGPAPVIFGGKPIINGMIKALHTYSFTFDGTNWRLINPSGIHTLPDDDNSNSFVSSEWVRRNIVGVAKGESTTPSDNPNKTAKLRSTFMDPVVFMRQIGTTVAITFDNEDRSGETPTTLNVEDSGAATILFAGIPLATGMLGAKHTHMFVFDGTNWRLINPVPGTGMGNINIGPGDPDPDNPDKERVLNRLSGHMGMTVHPSDHESDRSVNGKVNLAHITLGFTPKVGGVEIKVSDYPDAWSVMFGDGTYIKANFSQIVSTTKTNAVLEFILDEPYPSNSPCQLVYRTNKAWITIKEI